jgi:hypothetical protein
MAKILKSCRFTHCHAKLLSYFFFSWVWNLEQAAELEIEAYPLLDELTSKISTLNLEQVRRLKSRLVALTRRVQKVILKYSCFLSSGTHV